VSPFSVTVQKPRNISGLPAAATPAWHTIGGMQLGHPLLVLVLQLVQLGHPLLGHIWDIHH
jgi:hypothetical protein